MYYRHKHGLIHISSTGVVEFYSKVYNCRSREVGPAYIHSRGTIAFYHASKFHRETGPAIIYFHGKAAEYWIDDRELSVEEFFSLFGTT